MKNVKRNSSIVAIFIAIFIIGCVIGFQRSSIDLEDAYVVRQSSIDPEDVDGAYKTFKYNLRDVTIKSYEVDNCPGDYPLKIENETGGIQLLEFKTAKMMTDEIREEMSCLSPDERSQKIKEEGFLSRSEIEDFMRQNGYCSVALGNVTCFVDNHPELKFQNNVVGLATRGRNENGFLITYGIYVDGPGSHLNFIIMPADYGWVEGTLFAAVKIS
jgi:hypothetical protein